MRPYVLDLYRVSASSDLHSALVCPAKGAGRRRLEGASNLTSVSADEGTECPRRSAVRAPLEVAISRELIRNVVPLMI